MFHNELSKPRKKSCIVRANNNKINLFHKENQTEDALTSELKYILSLVIDWLKFAENKNGVLLAANSGFLLAAISLFIDRKELFLRFFQTIIICSFIFLGIAIFISLLSFISNIKPPKIIYPKQGIANNVLFFNSIGKYESPEDYLNLLCISKKITKKVFQKIELDFANQIINISRIALNKFIFFNISIYITGFTVVILVIFSIISMVKGLL